MRYSASFFPIFGPRAPANDLTQGIFEKYPATTSDQKDVQRARRTSSTDFSHVAISPTPRIESNPAPVAATATGFPPVSIATIPFPISFAMP